VASIDEAPQPDAQEYDELDGDVYDENGPRGEEEPELHTAPPPAVDREQTEAGGEQVLAPGYGIIVNSRGERFPAQVLKTFKKSYEAAKLSKQGDRWEPVELVKLNRDTVVRSFPMEGGGVPANIEALLQGDLSNNANTKTAATEDQEQVNGEVQQVGGGEHADEEANDSGDLAAQMESDEEPEGQAEALAAKAPKLPENKAKNQVEATKDEIASSCASGSQQIICS